MNDSGVAQNHKSYDAVGNVTAKTNAAKDVTPLPELVPLVPAYIFWLLNPFDVSHMIRVSERLGYEKTKTLPAR